VGDKPSERGDYLPLHNQLQILHTTFGFFDFFICNHIIKDRRHNIADDCCQKKKRMQMIDTSMVCIAEMITIVQGYGLPYSSIILINTEGRSPEAEYP
jgi:hypothetical protein